MKLGTLTATGGARAVAVISVVALGALGALAGLQVWSGAARQAGVPVSRRAPPSATQKGSHRPLRGDPNMSALRLGAVREPTLAFEPNVGQTNPQAKFLAHGGAYGLFLDGNQVVLALASRQSSVLSAQSKRHPWSDVRGPLQKTTDNRLRIGLIGSMFPSPFSIGSSEFSPAPSAQHPGPSVVRLRLVGANPDPKVIGLDKLKGKSNYFIGNDPKKWRTNVPNYARAMVRQVYPGVDQVFYGKGGQLEYDFVVHPGADPKQIRLAAETGNWKLENGSWKIENRQSKIENASNGDLVLQTEAGEVRFGKPVVYQATTDRLHSELITHNSRPLEGNYVLSANNELRFEVGTYDPTRPLIIDPTLKFIATFGGADGSQGHGIATDSAGNAYVTGFGGGTGFPTTPGAFQPSSPVTCAFVRKVDPSGAAVYSTDLGGSSGDDQGYAIAVDASGDAYVTGITASIDFPVLNAFQPALAGASDAFVTELNPEGNALIYSSYLGGSLDAPEIGTQSGSGIAVDSAGSAYVTGLTQSPDFPTTPGSFQTTIGGGECSLGTFTLPCPDAFVTKVAAGGSALVYSTYLGGSDIDVGLGIAVDHAGNAYLAGQTDSLDFPLLNAFQSVCHPIAGALRPCSTAFVSELGLSGSALVFSTYLGGSGSEEAFGVAADSAGAIYVTGYTGSTDFPTANAFQPSFANPPGQGSDAFVTEFNPGASQLIYSTYFGGTGNDTGTSVAVDSLGEAFITGVTNSTDFPISNALQTTYAGGTFDAFVAGFQAGGQRLIYSTYLGGTGQDIGLGVAVDGAGNSWVTGQTNSTTFLAAISRPEVVHRDVAPRPLATSAVTAALAGSIALDMARLHAAPASLAFAVQVAGTTSAPETVTISNPGTASLTFSSISASDSFTVPSGGSCSTSSPVAPGGNCTVDVAFAPTVGGNLTGTLTLTDNGIGSPHSVPLSGTGQDFTFGPPSGSPTSATVAPGSAATYTLSVGGQGGLSGTVTFTCAGAPAEATCTASPNPVTVGSSATNLTVTVTTTAPSVSAPRGPNGPGPIAGHRPALQRWLGTGHPQGVPLLALLALLAVAAASRRRRPHPLPSQRAGSSGDPWIPAFAGMTSNRHAPAFLALALGLLLVLAWAACGGGGTTPLHDPGTPAGTSTLTVTGSTGSGSATLSHSVTLTLTVQ